VLDLILRNGTVIDGTGSPRTVSDIGIAGDRIEIIDTRIEAQAKSEIDCTGLVVAPGFIDVHNHSDGWLIREPNFAPKTAQGFSTEVLMADGIGYAPINEQTRREWFYYLRSLNGLRLDDHSGWETFDEYLSAIDGQTAQNACSHLPYANIRSMACGFRRCRVDDFQMREIQRQVTIGMEAGAVGVSTGLDYIVQCFSPTDELVEALSAMSKYDGLYVTHVRYKKGLLPAMREAFEIGRRANVRVHISHLKGQTPGQVEQVLELLDEARKDVDLSFDSYPYQPGSTMLSYLLPNEVWEDGPLAVLGKLNDPTIRQRFSDGLDAYRLPLENIRIAWVLSKENSHLQGLTLSEYISDSGLSQSDALLNLLIDERLSVLLVFDEGDDRLIEPLLQHDLFMLGTDGIYQQGGQVHPRVFGSVGRYLGALVRDKQLLTLEQGIHRMTGFSADRFRLAQRGQIKQGWFADLTVFDAEKIIDHSTYDEPQQLTTGVEHLFVNGVCVFDSGGPIENDCPPGRAIYVEQ
jgi:N-acyl-D-amino-acid deacylase